MPTPREMLFVPQEVKAAFELQNEELQEGSLVIPALILLNENLTPLTDNSYFSETERELIFALGIGLLGALTAAAISRPVIKAVNHFFPDKSEQPPEKPPAE